MSCNSTYFALPFTSTRDTVSLLYDVIDMGDMDFGYNDTSEDFMYIIVLMRRRLATYKW